MSNNGTDRKVFCAMPAYDNRCTLGASKGFWRCCRNLDNVWLAAESGSLLAATFNMLWCHALNLVHNGERVDYFAMLHADIGPEDFWLDKLIDELEEKQLDVLGVAVPIKDTRGVTSIAVDNYPETWRVKCRLTLDEIFRLPETFTSDDIGYPLLLNTGCWVCKFDMEWAKKFRFEINDRIVFNTATKQYQPENESEDWFGSRLFHEFGLKVGATRKVRLCHTGDMEFTNTSPCGAEPFDKHIVNESIIPPVPSNGAFRFPHDVDGWLLEDEGKKLAELAKDKRVLEIGSYCGKSTICLAQTAMEVISIDPHDGRGTPDPRETFSEFVKNLERYNVRDKVHAYVGTLDDETLVDPCDFIFIDGCHDYEAVKADIEHALEVLTTDGVLAFHDYRQVGDRGVRRAVNELLADGGELLSLTTTLAVVKPPANIPCEV